LVSSAKLLDDAYRTEKNGDARERLLLVRRVLVAADFFSAQFEEEAYFDSAEFSLEADFFAEFSWSEKANFTFAKFLDRAIFPTKFPGAAIFF